MIEIETQTKADEYWSMTEGVFNCLIDTKRTIAFQKAIKKTVSKGDVVVDMGTGSGILAMMAAKAGAKKVYAVEIDPNNIKTLRDTFLKNGFENTIEVIEGSILDVQLPEKVDVVIGEMIATGLIEELQVLAMNHIHNFTKKNTKVLLNEYDSFVELVDNQNHYYGFDFDILRYEYPDEKKLRSKIFTSKAHIAHFDFSKKIKQIKISSSVDLTIKKKGVINAIKLSGVTTFYDKSKLGGTFAYDYPLILPIDQIKVSANDVFKVTLSYRVCGGLDSLKYSVVKL